MEYEEALVALQRARNKSWAWSNLAIHDGIVQATEVFRRMKVDLDMSLQMEREKDLKIEELEEIIARDRQ